MTNERFILKLKKRLQEPLPGWKIQSRYLPVKGLPDIQYKSRNELRKGAVLTCLYEKQGQLQTILIERTQDTSPHSGQIAFPGGKYEESDKTQITTAFREAWEEVGLNPEKLELIGQLSPVEIPVSGFTVLPVVAWHKGTPELEANPAEVQTLIQTPVRELLKSLKTEKIPVRQHQVTTPCFRTQNFIVWGATAMVLGELREIMEEINPLALQE